jgi:hypothetical protein
LKVFPRPIEYVVGKSTPADWPYIHPSTNDGWAGRRAHTFTIPFKSERIEARPYFLMLGVADAHGREQSLITVSVNGKALPSQRAPKGPGGLAQDPRGLGQPSVLIFKIPPGSLKDGENSVAIKLEQGSWIIYDYVLLSADPRPPRLGGERSDLIDEALKTGLSEIVFALRQPGKDGHWYANFGYYAEDTNRLTYGDGGRLCRLNLRTGKLTTLLDDPKGGIRDPFVDYDGKKILFSYRKGGTPFYHLYEINAEGSNLRQLTDGPRDDIEPIYLPEGDIMFCSSRCNRWVNCWLTQVAVLYRCGADGKNVRMISSNNEHDNTPWMLPDGRVLYTRWEYVDRSQVLFHHLWVINPDGTSQMVYYGNMYPGVVMIDAKPIPGTNKVLASFSPGHGRREHDGAITIIDPAEGPDAKAFARRVSRGVDFRDPYPLSEDCFLVAQGTTFQLMDGAGATQIIYELPPEDVRAGLWCHEPRPLLPHLRECVVPPRNDLSAETGRLILADVNYGRNMEGVKRGEIKKLLVLETLPKPINFTGGMEPLSFGGTFTLERILGTVPVEPDGSAYMEVPALRSLFFVALDENDLSVKRMQSFVTVQPGETTGCAGCHEARTLTPARASTLMALRRPPSKVAPIADVPEVFDFPRDIQPILDKHCIKCHDYDKPPGDSEGPRAGGVILTGDRGPMYSHSYCALFVRGQVCDGRNGLGNRAPRTIGSSASLLMKKIDGSHHGVKVSAHEAQMVRLWIDSGAPYPGTYAALGTGMMGGYNQNRLDRCDLDWPSTRAAMEAMKRRCGGCHVKEISLPESVSDDQDRPPWAGLGANDPRKRFSRHILYNLTRPEKSMLLLAPFQSSGAMVGRAPGSNFGTGLAPLSTQTGGYGLCRDESKKPAPEAHPPPADVVVFSNADDPDYRAILAAIREAKEYLDTIKRFDMPGFCPSPHYVREMKRYGIMPSDVSVSARGGSASGGGSPIDVYAADRAYWRSFWYRR